MSKWLFTQLWGRDIKTNTDTWKYRHTFLHVGLSDLKNKCQWSVFICMQTDQTKHWKNYYFSQALVWCLNWVEQYSKSVVGENELRYSVFKCSVLLLRFWYPINWQTNKPSKTEPRCYIVYMIISSHIL